MGHHINSPSSIFRRLLCPGSARMEKDLLGTDNEHTLRGTAAHEVAAQCLLDGKTPGYWLGQPVDVKKVDGTTHRHIFNEEDNEAVWVYVDYVSRRKDALGPYASLKVESKIDPGIWLHRDDVDGTLDCALVGNTEIEIIDYKHGSGVAVEAENNPQLSEYAIGQLAELDWDNLSHDIPVHCTIVQPRCPHPQGPIRTWTVPASHFFGLVEEYKAKLALTDDPEAPLVPGESQCRFCKARSACPAVAQAAMEVFTPVNPVSHALAEDAASDGAWASVERALGRPMEVLTVADKVAIKDKMPMIQAWLKGIDESLLNDALDGKEIPGYKLVRGKSIRKWNLEDSAIILKLAGVRDRDKKAIGREAACTIKPLSPAQAEKSIKPRVTDRVWKNVEKLITKPEGAPTLAPLTDPRQAIVTAETAFQPVTTENPFG